MTTFDIDSKDPSTITATPSPPDTRKLNDGKDTAPSLENGNIENGEFQHGSADEAGLLDLLSKPQIVIMWVGLLLMSTINYLNVSVLFTLSVYALSDFNHAAAEGTLGTIFGVVAIAIQAPLSLSVRQFHDFDVCLVVVVISILASVVEAATRIVGGYIFGFALNIVSMMKLSSIRHRTLALNISQLPMLVSLLGGPPISQALLDSVGWRWGHGLFAIIIPASNVILLAMLFVFRRRTTARNRSSTKARATELFRELKKQDIVGIFLLVAGCALFLLPIPLEIRGVAYYDTAGVITPTAIGAVLLICFFVWELRFAKRPFLEKRLLTNISILGCMATTVFNYASQQFSIVYIFSWIFVASDESISNASYISQVASITSSAFGLAVGVYVSWVKRAKWSLVLCNAVLVLGCILQYVFINPKTHEAAVIVSQTLLGFGWVGAINALSIAQALTKVEEMPIVTALFFVMANFGGGFASSISGGLWTSLLLRYLTEALPADLKSQAADFMGSIVEATSYEWGTPERDDIAGAYMGSYRAQALGSLVCAILALLVSLHIKNVALGGAEEPEMELGEKDKASDEARQS